MLSNIWASQTIQKLVEGVGEEKTAVDLFLLL
jgi:hypothetical protein